MSTHSNNLIDALGDLWGLLWGMNAPFGFGNVR